jgi:hypothetical protein
LNNRSIEVLHRLGVSTPQGFQLIQTPQEIIDACACVMLFDGIGMDADANCDSGGGTALALASLRAGSRLAPPLRSCLLSPAHRFLTQVSERFRKGL